MAQTDVHSPEIPTGLNVEVCGHRHADRATELDMPDDMRADDGNVPDGLVCLLPANHPCRAHAAVFSDFLPRGETWLAPAPFPGPSS